MGVGAGVAVGVGVEVGVGVWEGAVVVEIGTDFAVEVGVGNGVAIGVPVVQAARTSTPTMNPVIKRSVIMTPSIPGAHPRIRKPRARYLWSALPTSLAGSWLHPVQLRSTRRGQWEFIAACLAPSRQSATVAGYRPPW